MNKAIKDNDRTSDTYKVMSFKYKRLSNLHNKTKELFKKNLESYKSFFYNSLDGIYRSTIDGKYINANPALIKMLGYRSKKELFSINIPDQLYISKTDRPPPNERNKLFETQLKKKDGTAIWVEISTRVIYDKKKPVYFEGIVRNITERKKSEEKIAYLSFNDSLTGLYNRPYFEGEIKRLDTKRQLPLSFVIGDINNLKMVNDIFGHLQGDKLIMKVAELLKTFCRHEDVIARWGGDEFTILLPQTKKEDAEELLNRIKNIFTVTNRQEIPISVSLGVATKEKINQNIQDVVKNAEDNMYRHKLIEKKSVHNSIITSLKRTLYEKNIETNVHSEHLKKLSKEIGETIHLPDNKMDELSLLSTLHDIGKIAVAEEILLNKRKLTKKEWVLVKKHPGIGYNICISNPQLSYIAEGVLGHHEWWNGDGYPQRLSGDNIPISSRIISIVDAYDVMISGRTYKKAITEDKARKELIRCSGTQFDPKLVNIFINIIKKEKNKNNHQM
ncbi:MAG: diguanylate cyclase [Actinobacteria bacterium]|nr:diguanylate cyclase [Actinomycetota bacterium]